MTVNRSSVLPNVGYQGLTSLLFYKTTSNYNIHSTIPKGFNYFLKVNFTVSLEQYWSSRCFHLLPVMDHHSEPTLNYQLQYLREAERLQCQTPLSRGTLPTDYLLIDHNQTISASCIQALNLPINLRWVGFPVFKRHSCLSCEISDANPPPTN